MKAWPHTHIGIARDDVGLFLGTRFLGSDSKSRSLLDQLLQYYPEANAAIIIPLKEAVRWELKEVIKEITTEWVKGDDSEE